LTISLDRATEPAGFVDGSLYLPPRAGSLGSSLEIVSRKDSKLLGRTELQVVFADKSGALNRKDAIKEVARAMNTDEKRVTLLELDGGSGTRKLVGWFHVYDSEDGRKEMSEKHLAVRLLTKEEKEEIKAAKKKADAAAAAAKAAAAPKAKKK
jgi:ribosomal protein S24E